MQSEANALFDQISIRDAVILKLNRDRFTQARMAQQLCLHTSTVKAAIERLEKLTGCCDMGELARWWGLSGRWWLVHLADETGLGPIDFGQWDAQRLSR